MPTRPVLLRRPGAAPRLQGRSQFHDWEFRTAVRLKTRFVQRRRRATSQLSTRTNQVPKRRSRQPARPEQQPLHPYLPRTGLQPQSPQQDFDPDSESTAQPMELVDDVSQDGSLHTRGRILCRTRFQATPALKSRSSFQNRRNRQLEMMSTAHILRGLALLCMSWTRRI